MLGYDSQIMFGTLRTVGDLEQFNDIVPINNWEFIPVEIIDGDDHHSVTVGSNSSTNRIHVYYGPAVTRSHYEGYSIYQHLSGRRVWIVANSYMMVDFGVTRKFLGDDFMYYLDEDYPVEFGDQISLISYEKFFTISGKFTLSDTVIFVNCSNVNLRVVYDVLSGVDFNDAPRFAMFYTKNYSGDTVNCRIHNMNLHYEVRMWNHVVSDVEAAISILGKSVDVVARVGSNVSKEISTFDKYVFNRSLKFLREQPNVDVEGTLLNDCVSFVGGSKYSSEKVMLYLTRSGSNIVVHCFTYNLPDVVTPSYYRSTLIDDEQYLLRIVQMFSHKSIDEKVPVKKIEPTSGTSKLVAISSGSVCDELVKVPEFIIDCSKLGEIQGKYFNLDNGMRKLSHTDSTVSDHSVVACYECGEDVMKHDGNSCCVMLPESGAFFEVTKTFLNYCGDGSFVQQYNCTLGDKKYTFYGSPFTFKYVCGGHRYA